MGFVLSAAWAAAPALVVTPVPWRAPAVSSAALVATAAEALRARQAMGAAAPSGATPAGDPSETLRWVVSVAAADRETGNDRLANPEFLAKCLESWRWTPDVDRPHGEIRLTRYLVYSVLGRAAAEGLFQFPLWALPHDEVGLSPADAEARRGELDRYRYTRAEVAAGVYREGGTAAYRADPLVWLTHEDHDQALLQGTVAVNEGDQTRLFNVFRNNGIPYDKTERDPRKQRAYWYFRPMDAVRGWAAEPVTGPELQPFAAVAGDLDAFGFGRLFALKTGDGLRLVVLADTGGAFVHNLHQLDLYTGIHASKAEFSAATGAIGDTAAAWVLRARPECAVPTTSAGPR